MVEMYLYPEVEILWAQAEQGRSPDQQPLEANLEAVTAAQKLLSDAHVTGECALQHKVDQHCSPPTIINFAFVPLCLITLPKQSL